MPDYEPDKWGYLPDDYEDVVATLSDALLKALEDRTDATTWATIKVYGVPNDPYQVRQFANGVSKINLALLVLLGYIELTDKGRKELNLSLVEDPE